MAALIVMALSVSAFAANSGTFTVEITTDWWQQANFADLTGESIEGHETLTISCTDGGNLIMCYNDASGEWVQLDVPENKYEIDLSLIGEDKEVFVVFSNESGNTYTVEWSFGDAAGANTEPETADGSETAAAAGTSSTANENANPDTGLAIAVIPAVISLAAVVVSKKR